MPKAGDSSRTLRRPSHHREQLERKFRRQVRKDLEKLGFKPIPGSAETQKQFDIAWSKMSYAALARRWRTAGEYKKGGDQKKKEFDF